MKALFITTIILSISLFQFGCASATSGARSSDLLKSYTVEKGTVTSVNEIVIDNSKGNHSGAVKGAGSGAVSGAVIDESVEGALVGALVGGLIGGVVEKATSTEKAYELDIQKADGTMIRVLQRKQSLEGITVGESVELLTDSSGIIIVKRLI